MGDNRKVADDERAIEVFCKGKQRQHVKRLQWDGNEATRVAWVQAQLEAHAAIPCASPLLVIAVDVEKPGGRK